MSSWRLVRSIVAMLMSSAAAIRLSLQPSPASDRLQENARLRQQLRGTLTFADQFIELGTWLAATEIQKFPPFSMTGVTSLSIPFALGRAVAATWRGMGLMPRGRAIRAHRNRLGSIAKTETKASVEERDSNWPATAPTTRPPENPAASSL
jgi:hypothetical protein